MTKAAKRVIVISRDHKKQWWWAVRESSSGKDLALSAISYHERYGVLRSAHAFNRMFPEPLRIEYASSVK